MTKKEAIEHIKKGLHELRELVGKKTKFSTEEFSLLVSCLECLDRHVVGEISDKSLLDVRFDCK